MICPKAIVDTSAHVLLTVRLCKKNEFFQIGKSTEAKTNIVHSGLHYNLYCLRIIDVSNKALKENLVQEIPCHS